MEYRFIPATAGNTRAVYTFSLINAVYPRYRGEHARDLIAALALAVYPRYRGEHQ